MSVKLKIVRDLLTELINNIDAGNSNKTEEELDEIINSLTRLNRGVKRISKTYACDKILHCSHSTFDTYLKLGIIPPGHKEIGFKELSWSEKDFDTYLKLGIIPPGHKEIGFKELSWSEKDFDEATMNKVRKYRTKNGL